MPPPLLPTPWNVFNLRVSPYWQESLGGSDAAHPLSLLVGRAAALSELEAVLYGAGESSSRQAVAGAPGVGKTTLVRELKARARARGYLTVDDFVPLLPGDTPDALFGRVLGLVYETVLANRPVTAGNTAMLAAQQLVRVGRITTGRGGGASAFGLGGNLSTSGALTAPRDLMIDGPRVLRDVLSLARGADAHGILVHLNNLENLTEADAAAGADLLRALRDPMLLHPGLHVVVVGSTDAVQTVVNTHQQVRQTFSTQVIQPLDVTDVHRLLAARYDYGRLDAAAPALPPVDPAAVGDLHDLYRGDLRGLLKALDDGVRPNIGLAVAPPAGGVREGGVARASPRAHRLGHPPDAAGALRGGPGRTQGEEARRAAHDMGPEGAGGGVHAGGARAALAGVAGRRLGRPRVPRRGRLRPRAAAAGRRPDAVRPLGDEPAHLRLNSSPHSTRGTSRRVRAA